jgi:hypothetical protein
MSLLSALLSAGDELIRELRAAADDDEERRQETRTEEARLPREEQSPLSAALAALSAYQDAVTQPLAQQAPHLEKPLSGSAGTTETTGESRAAPVVNAHELAGEFKRLLASLPSTWPSTEETASAALLENVMRAIDLLYSLALAANSLSEDADEPPEDDDWEAGWGDQEGTEAKASGAKANTKSTITRLQLWQQLETGRNSLRRLVGFGAALFLSKAFRYPPPPPSDSLTSLKGPSAADYEKSQLAKKGSRTSPVQSQEEATLTLQERILSELLSSLAKLQHWSFLRHAQLPGDAAASPRQGEAAPGLSQLPSVLWAVQVISDPILKRFRTFVSTQVLKDKEAIAAVATQGTKAKLPEPRPTLEQLLDGGSTTSSERINLIFAWLWTNAMQEGCPVAASLSRRPWHHFARLTMEAALCPRYLRYMPS